MAKKRASGKRRGTDAGGQPIDLSKDALESYWSQRDRARKAVESGNRAELVQARRNQRDLMNNRGVIATNSPSQGNRLEKNAPMYLPMPAAKGDTLSGRTVEAGTRSMREGLRAWVRDMRGGGGSRLTGR